MALIMDALIEILKKPTIGDIVSELAMFAAPLWIAVFVGLVVGWSWRPRWAADLVDVQRGNSNSGSSLLRLDNFKGLASSSCEREEKVVEISAQVVEKEERAVTSEDLKHLFQLVEVTDGGPAWQQMMNKTMPGFAYRAWKREPETGPPQYRSSTIFEDATPEMVRDFFWDDEFRTSNRWDDMLLQHTMLEECGKTGTMVVRWVRKFPFFCSDREYVIGRRIWNAGGTYYCVTKGVPRPMIPRHSKPRRVDLYYSSWCIRAVESRRGDGQMTACEVLLFHHEDMGIPWEIAKLGVRQGMWGCVRKIEPGLRDYQSARSQGQPQSKYASMANINTKVHTDYLKSLEGSSKESSEEIVEVEKKKTCGNNLPKFLIVGGAVIAACSIDRGLLTKAVIFGVARRFGKLGR
ncbi:uncharacterized protein A4U43_C04F11750 [Asparagus officinalis]|uniref:START domain-containing protein n=1 Tax=Asparagus officinalis TaxID=4686 RepID=A0A5P1F044_ASPOF|nr:uncharacterized protein LOC109837108 [Asparagus officinalis]ONK71728.1 uncharacterized protein A4U43_C04F11750 [Asparagus officinalis]